MISTFSKRINLHVISKESAVTTDVVSIVNLNMPSGFDDFRTDPMSDPISQKELAVS